MRLLKLIKGDIIFQARYGFYLLFIIFSFIYIVTIKALPDSISDTASWVMILTDPTALGLVFMGAIIHFEISERTINSLYISPIKPSEYLISKMISLAVLSTFSALLIGVLTGTVNNYLSFIIGVFIGSLIFSAIGLILAFKTSSMNQFILGIIPAMVFIILPGAFYIIFLESPWFIIHPAVAISELIINGSHLWISLLSLGLYLIAITLIALKVVKNKFNNESGGSYESDN
ncbi:hypothetical protein CI105_08110 [Candidatus Izimaplasma bacterium ZiA1]|uniref:fluoroquinolone export ABC transporter permease subunit n=1 Tax=Candidatus Izimoplasma sp. ZiA1 TaxID=2024899 RepID=UPI000BAA4DAA|nr:hypothetical protein CI105_08110 [Candidatus Izimaplasma bacterium ZiA1]